MEQKKNKKVAILTLYYKSLNYGGILQAFALQNYLETSGYDSRQISYIYDSGFTNWNYVKYLLHNILIPFYHLMKYKKWEMNFLRRRRKVLKFSNSIPHTKIVTKKSIGQLSNEFDFFICGSDQIWNPIGWQSTFFLDFIPDKKKKISYAASIARDSLTKAELSFIEPYLYEFSYISVREKNSAILLNEKLSDINIIDVPDPVFLLNRSQWDIISERGHNKIEGPYIFAYFLGENEENRRKAINFAKKMRLKIFFVGYTDKKLYGWEISHRDILLSNLGVEDFLKCISKATIVITDSFHAAAFSAIFHTPFYALPRFNKTDVNSMNSRLKVLVEELGIEDRFVEDLNNISSYSWSEDEIKSLECNLLMLKNKGRSYLQKSLGDN